MRSQFYNPEREPLTPANGRTAGVLPQAPSGDARANDSGFCGQIEMVPLNHLYGLTAGMIYTVVCGYEMVLAHALDPACCP